jgi:hypothetical protein
VDKGADVGLAQAAAQQAMPWRFHAVVSGERLPPLPDPQPERKLPRPNEQPAAITHLPNRTFTILGAKIGRLSCARH